MSISSFTTWLLLGASTFFSLAFDSDDDDVQFYLNTYRTFIPGEEVTVHLNGRFTKSETVEFDLYRILRPVDFFNEQQNVHAPGVGVDDEGKEVSTLRLKDTKMFREAGSWNETIRHQRYWAQADVTVPVQESGVYLVTARVGKQVATTVVIISPAGLIVKQSSDRVLGYTTSLVESRRIADARVVFRKGEAKIEKVSGADGIASRQTSELPEPTGDEVEEPWHWRGGGGLVVYGEAKGDFFISDSWYYHYGGGENAHRLYLHTDRPVYRPEQTVYYRGILRSMNTDGTYALPKEGEYQVTIHDPRGDELTDDVVRVDDFGTFHGEVTLGEEPPLGYYRIEVLDGSTSVGGASFEVLEYKKPEFEVKVSTPKGSYTGGDRVTVNVQTDYYFGSPVAEGTVEYRILRSRYFRPWWEGSRWAYLYRTMPAYSWYGSDFVDQGTGQLNADGSFSFSFDTPKELEHDYTYTLVANVTDASRRTISGSSTIRVTRGEFYLSARTTQYVYKPGDQVELIVNAQSFDGDAGVATDFAVKVTRTWWDRRDRHSEETVFSGNGRTGADGEGRISFPADMPGYYSAQVTAKDGRGNEIGTSAGIYVADGTYQWGPVANSDVQIIPDRDLYQAGETITALVIMPAEDIDALITVEGPTIFSHQVVRLSGTSAIVRIPVEERFAPNVFISVSALAGSRLFQAEQQVTVAPTNSIVTLEISTDREEYRPGDAGTVTIRALDAKGNPVPNVDVALGMVDESIYAIRPDNTEPIETSFFGQRWNQVSTSTSLSFRFWNQSVEFNVAAERALGAGDVEDGAVSFDMLAAPVANQKLALDRSGGDIPLVQPTLRQDFRDLMFWTHSVRTDSRGYAEVPVEFPDNLTTWRITARGITRATQVGQSTAKVIARKNLLVRMETPRFITEGDSLAIATNVHNYLATEKEVTLQFAARGLWQGTKSKKVTIPANGEMRVDWPVRAETIGDAVLTIRALTDEESDAMELTVPILPEGVLTGTSAITDVSEERGSRTMTLELPEEGRLQTAILRVNLSPSAASSMIGALDELIGYPYGCVEQTMSRFLPTVVVADVLKELNVPFDQAKREELPKMVEQGLTRLRTLQHEDGGWGWWEHDETNPFMTAYVMYGLTVARTAGYEVDENVYGRGSSALYSLIESRTAGGSMGSEDSKLNRTTEAYMLYVASILHDRGDANGMIRDRIEELSGEQKINPYGVALLALASVHQEDRPNAERLAARLRSSVEETATGASWSGESWHYTWQEDRVETSAAAVRALLAIDGETELVKKGVRWLLSQKQGSAWHNTRQTAMVIYSLVDYLKVSNELNPDYEVIVKVNGTEVDRRRITSKDVFSEETVVKIGPDRLRSGANVVTIEKAGGGRLYASARLTYFAVGDAIRAGEAGFTVEREYFRLERVKRKGRYMYEKKKITGPLQSGEEIFVRLRVTPESSYEYVMVEDPLPAGCEVITDTEGYEIVGEDEYSYNEDSYYRGWHWNYWYADREVRDEKITFFATYMSTGTREMTYIMRAQIPGTYGVMPAVAALMYYPEVRGNSGAIRIAVQDRPAGSER